MRPKRFIDLFCGIGGFRIAHEGEGLECVFSSDKDRLVRQTYELNYGESPSGDITGVRSEDIPPHDIICAGFPCQSFSISGKQEGFKDKTRGTLFFDIIRIAKHHRPSMMFLENVKNLGSHDQGRTIAVIKSSLREIGYDHYCKVLNSAAYGVATARSRIYIVCFRSDLGISDFSWPEPTMDYAVVRSFLRNDLDVSRLAIKRNDIVLSSGEDKVRDGELFDNESRQRLSPMRIGKISYGGQGDRIYSIDGPAITFSAGGGGNGSKTGAYLMPDGTVRKLHPLEATRIMTFPETFRFPDGMSIHQCHRQLGNSVVVKMISLVLKKALEAMDGKPTTA